MIEILQNGVHDTAVLWTGSDAAVLAPPYWCIVLIAADRLCADHDHFSISVFDELLNIPIETVFEHYFTDSVLFRDFVASLKMSGKLYWPKWSYCVLLLLYLLRWMLVSFKCFWLFRFVSLAQFHAVSLFILHYFLHTFCLVIFCQVLNDTKLWY